MDLDRVVVFRCGVGVAACICSTVECDIVWGDWIVCRVWLAYGIVSVLGDEVDVV